MLTFQAIGDGNCLYNAEAILLIQAFRQKELDPLFKNKQHLIQFHQLLKIFERNELIEMSDKITQKAVKDGFRLLVDRYTTEGKIDWDTLQEEMAPSLREFVQNAIITDDVTNKSVRAELIKALDFSIEIGAAAVGDLEERAIDGSYFEEMPAIKAKIIEILGKNELSVHAKKIALSEWFFEGEAVGFSDYLQGENGIGNEAIHATNLEVKVLSSKLGIVHRSYMRGAVGNEQSATYYNGFLSDEKSRELSKNAIVFSLEKAAIHWDALFIDTPANRALVEEREAQIRNNELAVYLEKHGTYKAHCESLEMSEKEYCTLYGLTKKQFENPPVVAKPKAGVKKPAADVSDKSAEVKKDDTVAEDKPTSTVANTNVTKNFALNWLAASAILGVVSHFFLMPLITGAVMSSALVAPSALLMLGITLAISSAGGFFVANNMGNTATNTLAKAVVSVEDSIVSSKIKTAHVEKAPVDLLEKTPSFLVYQNTRAQTAKRAEIAALEGKPNLPRHKLN